MSDESNSIRLGCRTHSELPRAAGELLALPPFAAALAMAPRGDGHSVLVIPGWHATDASTAILRAYLGVKGFSVHGWGLGPNLGITRSNSAQLRERVADLASDSGRPVSLVGWSLGGVLAYNLERQVPDLVRRVVTLGSPLNGVLRTSAPTTSVYSKGDRVVSWRSSRIQSDARHENVEVFGSHIGLGHNPSVLFVLADRLHQADGLQAPFGPNWFWRRMFPRPNPAPHAAS